MKIKHDEPANDVNVAEKKRIFSNTNLMTPMLQNPARSRNIRRAIRFESLSMSPPQID